MRNAAAEDGLRCVDRIKVNWIMVAADLGKGCDIVRLDDVLESCGHTNVQVFEGVACACHRGLNTFPLRTVNFGAGP